MQLDHLIHNANSEISHLKNKLASKHTACPALLTPLTHAAFEIEHHSLMRKNHELIEAYNEKARSNARSQAAYDTLKKRLLKSSFESAAADAVEESLHFAGDEHSRVSLDDNVRSNVELLRQPGRTVGNVKNIYSHVREGSSSSNDGLHKFAPRLASVVQRKANDRHIEFTHTNLCRSSCFPGDFIATEDSLAGCNNAAKRQFGLASFSTLSRLKQRFPNNGHFNHATTACKFVDERAKRRKVWRVWAEFYKEARTSNSRARKLGEFAIFALS